MVAFWSWLTTLLDLMGLALTLCLGFYLVTRTLSSRLAWLAAVTLWSVAGVFLHNALLVYVPTSYALSWLRPLLILALATGFHLIMLLPAGGDPAGLDFLLPPWRMPARLARLLRGRAVAASRGAVPLAYGLGVSLLLIGVYPLGIAPHGLEGPAAYLSHRVAGRLYPAAMVYLLLFVTLALMHVWQRQRGDADGGRRSRYLSLYVSILLTALGGGYLLLGIGLALPIPSFPADVAMGVAALMLGYLVAQHNAETEGAALNRDLLYISLGIGTLTVVYVLIAQFLHLGGHMFSTVTLIMIVIVGTSSLMLYDGLRSSLDRLFYREHFRQLRSSLRTLSREAGIGQPLPDRLRGVLTGLCSTLGARGGLIALRQGDLFVCEAAEKQPAGARTFDLASLGSAEIIDLPGQNREGVEDMGLLVPLWAEGAQIGALVLGTKKSGRPFGDQDLLFLDDVADQLAAMIRALCLQEENARMLSRMVSGFCEQEHALQRGMQQMLARHEGPGQGPPGAGGEEQLVGDVEDALRWLHDYSYLGEHSLAQMEIVTRRLEGREREASTHLDRGRALSEVLLAALHELRPIGEEPKPSLVPTREWHQFLVLQAAYVGGCPNRDIMSRLYISEGTFNRTRRRALRAMAKALREMNEVERRKPAR